MHRPYIILLLLSLALAANAAQSQLSIQTGVQLNWPTATGNTYRLQWSPAAGGPWTDLSTSIPGTGTTNTFYDSSPTGTRHYRVLEIVPGSGSNSAIPVNGSFELGSGTNATNWTTSAFQPPIRSSATAHSGGFSMHSALTNTTAASREGMLSQSVAAQGGTVVGGQTYTFSFWAFQVTSGSSYVQQYQVQWRNAANAIIGGTGLANFKGVIGTWTNVSIPNLAAPADAVDVRINFRFVTGAVNGDRGEVFIDDVFLQPAGGSSAPGQTNVLQVPAQPMAKVTWPTESGVEYQPFTTTNLTPGTWTNYLPNVIGNGSSQTISLPIVHPKEFIHVRRPKLAVLPPTNLRTVASGVANAIGLAWTASPSAGVLSYRILHGPAGGTATNTIDVGNVTSSIVSGLTPGQTYFLAVIARTADSESAPQDATILAQPEVFTGIVPLYDFNTLLEPPTTVDTPSALVTYLGDRARDRHAREGMFSAYDHYLSWYWEERTIAIEIIDQVAKGGTNIIVNYTTLTPLGAPEFRAFFRGINTVAEYHYNYSAPLVGSNQYQAILRRKLPENRALQFGDRIELEISQFIEAPEHGRNNYYGTAILYVVGQGIVPWEGLGPVLDSYPLPESAWLGGRTTLPYQYSNEPEHRFKQMAGNIAPTNAQPFMLGRRLHHTDFGNGTHSESGNPVFTNHIGKLGPKFIARSCVQCHVNNGRALPPALGAPMHQTVVKVGSDPNGLPHSILGSVLQPQATNTVSEGSATITSYTTNHGQYADGTSYSLRKPVYTFQGVAPTYFSARIAPPLVGLGLLEAVSENTILALADPDDTNADGISGRAQVVTDPETGVTRLGRFTSKAGMARLSHQIASAFNTDLGITTTIFPILDGENTNRPPEISATELDQLTRYISLLGVSARRNLTNGAALRGEELFTTANCVKCHHPTLTTSPFHPMAELREQTIHPYTDLLLHDMGPGLADNMGEHGAAGSEWRTPPLWSIGLTAGVGGGEAYLHDGRAASLEEAILWHGGEAEAARESFRTMPPADRNALIEFLKSL